MRIRARSAAWRIAAFLLLTLTLGSLIAVQGLARTTKRVALPAGSSLDVQPFPGTPDASPQTSVSFPALPASGLRSIRVTGSRSGAHSGKVVAAPGGRGTEFIPARPFVSGDRVSVHATLGSRAAAAAVGAPGSTRIAFSFGVMATDGPVAGPAAPANAATAAPEAAYVVRHDIRETNTWTHTFHSNPSIHPPLAWTSGKVPDPAAGDIFADVHRAYVQAGPLIFSPTGQLVWFNPIPNRGAAFNTAVQRYHGQQVLTYWQGYTNSGYGAGEDVILNHHYQTIATVNAGNGYQADLHEFQILPNGEALITAYAKVPNVDLRSVGGPKSGILLDSIIQEINIATGHVDWEWHAYGHVRLWETYAGKPQANLNANPYDFFHINSIQMLPNGNLLVAARHTWTVYEINMKNGKIPYNFGGKNSTFRFGGGANYEWEHDATIQRDGTMTVFDDADGYYKSESQSRALRLSINYGAHTVSLVRSYTSTPPLLSQSQGSMQLLPDGYTFVGWGEQPYFTEFDKSSSRQLFRLKYNPPMESYRGIRSPWWGQPSTPPNIATAANGKSTTVYASWNGATTVSSWRVLAGSSRSKLTTVGTFPDKYFETTMTVRSTAPYFEIQGLGSGGGVRATSAVVPRGSAG